MPCVKIQYKNMFCGLANLIQPIAKKHRLVIESNCHWLVTVSVNKLSPFIQKLMTFSSASLRVKVKVKVKVKIPH